MAFAVVEFSAEKSVLLVPSNWLRSNHTICLWPKHTPPNLSKWIKDRKTPAENPDEWVTYSVRCFKFCG